MRWRTLTIGILLFSLCDARGDSHLEEKDLPAPPRRDASDALNKRVVDFSLDKFHWEKDAFVKRHGDLLPKALEGALKTADVDEIPIAALVADLFGTVNDTQLRAAFTTALEEKKKLEEKPESERSVADKEYLAYLARLLWAGRITKFGLPGFEMLDDVKKPEPKFSAFEKAFKSAFDRVLASNKEFHEAVEKINATKDPVERARLQKQLAERFGGIPKFLDGQVASSEKDKTGEQVAAKVAEAIAQKNAEGHNIDLFGKGDTPLRIELGNDPKKFGEVLRRARSEFAPLKDGGFGGTRLAAEPHKGSGVQTFSAGRKESPPGGPDFDDKVKAIVMKNDCLSCHGPDSTMPFFDADGQLKKGKSGKRFLQVIEGCSLKPKSVMAKKAKAMRENLDAGEKEALVAWAKKAGFGDLSLGSDEPSAEQCKKWEGSAPPPKPEPPKPETPSGPGPVKEYAHQEPPADLAEAKARGIFQEGSLLKPEDVLGRIQSKSAEKPLILNVNGLATIQGAKPIGPLNGDDDDAKKALGRLKAALAARKPGQELIVYCGCCKTDSCPFVMQALHEMAKLGVRDAKAIDFEDVFVDWVEKGYPVEK